MKKAIFYHAGCPVCVSAEQNFVNLIDRDAVSTEIVHLGQNSNRITEAESAGVKSVPALLLDGQVYHINYGASLEDVKKG
ncbi:MAG: thioredoxin family protein [Balneolaceae bacterium]|nr:MAG: thioredoxin family protein [Balneolaceae bacterium]